MTPWTVACQAPLSMGILQARILEWVAVPSSRGSSQCRDGTQVSCIASRFFTNWVIRVAPILETKWKIQHVDNAETKDPLNLRSELYSTITYIWLSHLMEMESKQVLPIPGWGKRSGRPNVTTWEIFLKNRFVFILICSWRSLTS